MYALIVGGGKVGYFLAKDLLARGHEVTVIERDERKCQRIQDDLGSVVLEGECTTDLLEQAGASRADVFIAVTGEDETNLVLSQIAKRFFHIPKAIARVVNPKNRKVFSQLGIELTVSATDIITSLIEQEMTTQEILPLLTLRRGTLQIVEMHLSADSPAIKKTVQQLALPEDSILISIIRGDQIIVPRGETTFRPNDTVLALTATAKAEDLKKCFYA
jgi:trk system potassium uptake protein TrkA